MTKIVKLPNQDDYIDLERISGFRIAGPNEQYKRYRVFIDLTTGSRCRWVQFKTKKSAQSFCAALKKKINNAR